MRSSTDTLVSALRILSQDIQTDDYVANAALLEAADRLEEVGDDNIRLEKEIDRLIFDLKGATLYADKLAESLPVGCLPKDVEILREANGLFAEENEDLKEEAIHLAQYARVLQLENEQLEGKLSEQSYNKEMNKFAMNLDKLKDEVFFELILHGSQVATGYDYKSFYTNTEGVPENWYEQFATDFRTAVRMVYKDETFFIVYTTSEVYSSDNEIGDIAYIFYKDSVYAFDAYFTDCEIFQNIIKG